MIIDKGCLEARGEDDLGGVEDPGPGRGEGEEGGSATGGSWWTDVGGGRVFECFGVWPREETWGLGEGAASNVRESSRASSSYRASTDAGRAWH